MRINSLEKFIKKEMPFSMRAASKEGVRVAMTSAQVRSLAFSEENERQGTCVISWVLSNHWWSFGFAIEEVQAVVINSNSLLVPMADHKESTCTRFDEHTYSNTIRFAFPTYVISVLIFLDRFQVVWVLVFSILVWSPKNSHTGNESIFGL